MDAKGTTKEGIKTEDMEKAAEIKVDKAAPACDKRKADATLDTAAKEASDAEKFDHGCKDAGRKSD